MTKLQKCLFLFSLAICTLSKSFAQENSTTIQLSVPSQINKQFFVDHPHIQSLVVEYKDGKAASLSLYYKLTSKHEFDSEEFYDLEFEGDKYLLSKRFSAYALYNLSAQGLIGHGILVKPAYRKYKIFEKTDMDFTTYDIMVDSTLKNEIESIEAGPFTAWYPGGNEKLTSDIKSTIGSILQKKDGLQNTNFLFRAVVNRDGSLTELKHISGERSAGLDLILQSIKKTSGCWKPELQSGRPVKSLTDIFVQINDKRELSISYSGLNRR